MGRQIQFHMLPEDERMFLDFVEGHDPVALIQRSAELVPWAETTS